MAAVVDSERRRFYPSQRTEFPLLVERDRVRGKVREEGSERQNLEATLSRYRPSGHGDREI
jgi:hypothetical protein